MVGSRQPGGAKRTFRRRSTLHHVVKDKQVTVQAPKKKKHRWTTCHTGELACRHGVLFSPIGSGARGLALHATPKVMKLAVGGLSRWLQERAPQLS